MSEAPADQVPAPAPAPAPDPAAEPAADPSLDTPEIKAARFKDDKRQAIYARRSEQNAASVQEYHEDHGEEATLSDVLAGGEPPPEPDPPPPPEPRKVKIVVFGQEQEVPEPAVFEAGVRTLQKQAAADRTLQEARAEAERVSGERTMLEAEKQRIRDSLARGIDPLTGQPYKGRTDDSLPATGAEAEDPDSLVKSAVTRIADGDIESGTAEMQAAIKAAVNAATARATGATPSPAGLPATLNMQPRNWTTAEKERGNAVFETEYGDMKQSAGAFKAAQTLVLTAMADPKNAGRAIEDVVREAANAARDLTNALKSEFTRPAPSPAPESTTDAALANRRTVKARMPIAPSVMAGRLPNDGDSKPPNEGGVESRKSYIETLRKRSGANSAPR